MFNHWNRPSRMATLAAAVLFGITLAANVRALDDCRVPTPNPCGVDGVCRPNVLRYGHYKTRWRPWPGEEKQLGATPDAADPGDQQLELEPLQRPAPEQENLRGPAKTKPNESKRSSDAGEAGEEMLEPQILQPQIEESEEPLPDFELQGNQPLLPIPTGEGPPALPQSLQQSLQQVSTHQLKTPAAWSPPSKSRPAVRIATATPAEPPALPNPAETVATRPLPVVKANFSASKQLQLVNPAAYNVVPESKLSKAAYFEVSDRPASDPRR